MAVKSKTQLAADIAASTFTAPQQVILDDMVDSYEDLAQPLTTVQIAAIATPTSGQLVYNTDLSQFQYYNGAAWVGLAFGLGVPQTVNVTVSSAELLALFTTPKTLIAAQGSGLSAVPIVTVVKTVFGTTAYDFAADLGVCASSNSVANKAFEIGAFNVNAGATCSSIIAGFANSNTTELVKANEAIQLKATANPTQGDGSLVISITYVVIAY